MAEKCSPVPIPFIIKALQKYWDKIVSLPQRNFLTLMEYHTLCFETNNIYKIVFTIEGTKIYD